MENPPLADAADRLTARRVGALCSGPVWSLLVASLLVWLPASAAARPCGDAAAVAAVLRLLSDRLGLIGALSLEHIHRAPTDPATGGPTCEAEIEGIRDAPVMLGRRLDMVRYWDEGAPGGDAPTVAVRLMPRRGAPAAPSFVDAAPIETKARGVAP